MSRRPWWSQHSASPALASVILVVCALDNVALPVVVCAVDSVALCHTSVSWPGFTWSCVHVVVYALDSVALSVVMCALDSVAQPLSHVCILASVVLAVCSFW